MRLKSNLSYRLFRILLSILIVFIAFHLYPNNSESSQNSYLTLESNSLYDTLYFHNNNNINALPVQLKKRAPLFLGSYRYVKKYSYYNFQYQVTYVNKSGEELIYTQYSANHMKINVDNSVNAQFFYVNNQELIWYGGLTKSLFFCDGSYIYHIRCQNISLQEACKIILSVEDVNVDLDM